MLALPKLNLQFLTVQDYLMRNFNLFRRAMYRGWAGQAWADAPLTRSVAISRPRHSPRPHSRVHQDDTLFPDAADWKRRTRSGKTSQTCCSVCSHTCVRMTR